MADFEKGGSSSTGVEKCGVEGGVFIWWTGMDHWTTAGTLEWTTGILEWITGMATYLRKCLLGGKVGLGPDSNLVLQLLK